MAYSGISRKLAQALPQGEFSVNPVAAADPTVYSAVAAAIAVLVSDAASPTQGHVNTLNTAWTTLKGALDSIGAGDITLLYDPAVVTTTNQGHSLMNSIMHEFIGRLTR